ncbi:MAG: PaaI family thioesterase [Acidobacteria bacterium]|jgi:acyl-coenzyme A thioesterase PaaI-like protein|nr:PaaI family thioesterase [Acidobacteriota bacterium]
MNDFNDNNYCFVCGSNNPHGLKLSFSFNRETGEVISNVIFPRHFQGWQNVLHGGILSTVLDEIMVKAAAYNGFKCVTAALNIEFKNPGFVEQPYVIKGKVNGNRGKIVFVEGAVIDVGPGNKIIASGTGKLFIL